MTKMQNELGNGADNLINQMHPLLLPKQVGQHHWHCSLSQEALQELYFQNSWSFNSFQRFCHFNWPNVSSFQVFIHHDILGNLCLSAHHT